MQRQRCSSHQQQQQKQQQQQQCDDGPHACVLPLGALHWSLEGEQKLPLLLLQTMPTLLLLLTMIAAHQ